MRTDSFDILEAMWLRRERIRRSSKEIEGVPPLTYTAKNAGTLKNYRIYGQTVDGESVGDRTGNLFDLNTWANTIRSISGDGLISISGSTVSITSVNDTDCYTEPYANNQTGVYKIPVKPNTIYTVNWYGSNYRIMIFENGSSKYMYNFFSDKSQSFTTHSDTTFLTLRFGVMPSNPVGTTATISEFIISEGSTPLPYEPYGYRVPVTVNDIITNLYLPEQIKKVGDEAEYIDYAEQKQHFADGTSVDVTLPALPTIAGTNTLSVGTQVQPSKVMTKGKLKE